MVLRQNGIWPRLGRAAACLWIAGMTLAGCSSAPQKQPLTDEEKAALYVSGAGGALTEGDPTGALELLNQAEALDPDNGNIFHTRAIALFIKKDVPAALEAAKKSIQLNPTDSDARNTLGRLYMEVNRPKEGEPHLVKAAADHMYRDNYKSHINLGIMYYRQGRFAEARERLNKALELAPDRSCVASYYRGHLFLKEGKFDRAIKDYEAATKRSCSSMGEAHLAHGIALERDGQYDKARRKFLDIRSAFPDTQIAEQAMERLRALP